MPDDPTKGKSRRRSGIRRSGGSIEDRIHAAREKRSGRGTTTTSTETTVATISQAPRVRALPAEDRPPKRHPLLFSVMLLALIGGLVWVALLPPVAPPLSETPPVVPAVVVERPAPVLLPEGETTIPAQLQLSYRLPIAPLLPLVFPALDPVVDGTPPRRAPQPPTEAAPNRSERPALRP